jgi:aminoglycoside 6-adenylyltransferase
MRSEAEMFDLILNFARQDERIHQVFLNGSRANPNAFPDRYRDFDIVFIVAEMESFLENDDWLDIFGKRLIMQKPEAMQLFPPEGGKAFPYLMLFEDGNRIDLQIRPLETLEDYLASDSLCVLLLDKDGLVKTMPESSERDYLLTKPIKKHFEDSCNEFWWLSGYVAKVLLRRQLPYANAHLSLMRDELLRQLSWQAGFREGFNFNIGKDYKYLEKHISAEDWQSLLLSWRNDSLENSWAALFESCHLFEKVSTQNAVSLSCALSDYAYKLLPYLESLKQDADSSEI